MFWRKQKAAIAEFPGLHQALIHERAFAATQPAAVWLALTASLGRHGEAVRRAKWALPPRTLDVLVPLIVEICSDLGPKGMLSVVADLRGVRAPGKSHPPRHLPVRPPVKSVAETWSVDPWLRLRADLRDGSTLEILVVDRERHRRITKRNFRNKTKTKSKFKNLQMIRVRRKLAPAVRGMRPSTPPPRWMAVTIRDGERRSILASAKFDRLPQNGPEQLDRILTVATEPFRWTLRGLS
ncbi:hypothetical protein [Actinoplanes derwentensis]|uniref:Uncharacterized protein n=1 Tax=Actinoplanes derwentensis TaxID=113562 RepID=A0A1H1YPN4_9ACTN|nr:hypothetical protein [Actinoplanes derwentensis]GID81236.1 hypothetical protein Ade03nite_01600 [Actinoplanes derwentensis]SDT23438.1 hypothetical protein SAMN04489716_2945 [Actinoplanes derwentensis]